MKWLLGLCTAGLAFEAFPLNAAEPVVRIVCSTGEFLFTDLTIKPR